MIQMKSDFKVIGFDADDTLWINEPYYRETEEAFYGLLSDFESPETISIELFKTEMQNLELYGFGVKAFMLSMIETALQVSAHSIQPATLRKIIQLGKAQLNKPVEIMDGVKRVLDELCRMGFRIPAGLRYAQLHVAAHHAYRPDGIRAPHEATARRAVAAVDRLLRAGTLGIDPSMGEILLEPEWVEGRTLGRA